MNPHPSAYAELIELAASATPGSRVAAYVDEARPRDDVSPSDVTWVLRQSDVLVVVVDGAEQIRADVAPDGSVSYPVADETGTRAFDRRSVKTLLAGEPFEVIHVSESRFEGVERLGGTPGLDGGESA